MRIAMVANALTLKSDAKLDCREKRKAKMASNTAKFNSEFAFEYDFTLKIRLKAGIGCVFVLYPLLCVVGLFRPTWMGAADHLQTAWVVYEFV